MPTPRLTTSLAKAAARPSVPSGAGFTLFSHLTFEGIVMQQGKDLMTWVVSCKGQEISARQTIDEALQPGRAVFLQHTPTGWIINGVQ